MTTRQVAIIGGVVGLTASAMEVALFRFGVLGVLRADGIDFVHILWPSSVMLINGWCSTVQGLLITVSSIAINCLLYALVALGLRACLRLVIKANRGAGPPNPN